MNKFYSIENTILSLKKNKKIIGLCHGVFDLLHYGHLKHFEVAKKKCDFLFVSITSSKFIQKGPNRPINDDNQRIFFLKNLKFIDYVFVAEGESGVDSINLIKPDFYFKGNDYKDNTSDKTKKILEEIKVLKKNKGKIIYTNEKQMSSSKIINQLGINLNQEQAKFLNEVKKKDSFKSIINALDKLKKNKVLVVGDLIIDRYIYGSVMGKSGKEPHMVFGEKFQEMYIGGSSVIANHISEFAKKITLVSDFGNELKIKNLLSKTLKKNILHIKLKVNKNQNTCIKTRFIDNLTKYKLFGSYLIPNLDDINFHKKLNENLDKLIAKQDIIIVADFSNNFFDLNSLKKIRQSKKFICGMAQKNSNNAFFHTINHLKNFDLLCINEGELRNELKDKKTKIELIAKQFVKKNNLKYLVVTMGVSGSLLFDSKLNKYFCPAFNAKPVDKVGAGDSMLAILSVLLKNKIHPMSSLLIASIVSSNVVNNVGNKYSVSKVEIERSLEYLLK
jgi:rfaE bifunctional protein nucleotidyltransferase chain/domain